MHVLGFILAFLAAMFVESIFGDSGTGSSRGGGADNPWHVPHHPRRRKVGIGPAIDEDD